MKSFTTYDPATGQIHAAITCQEIDVEANTPSGHARVDGHFRGDQHYIENGEAVPLKPMSAVVSGFTVSGLPSMTTARIEGIAYLIDDGVLELSPDLPGPYVVTLSAPGYLRTWVTVK